jgi:hypothetical protein
MREPMSLGKIGRHVNVALSLAGFAVLLGTITGCTQPGQTTGVGSGVGGAIGAGLGAIIGNQSGNAGSGVAIGAAAGAATGALIGNALEAQEKRTASVEEAVKRQERTIQAQKSEIAELREIRSDSGYSYDSYPTAATPRYRYRQTSVDMESPEVARQRARLQQRGPRPSGSSYESYQPEPIRQPEPTRRAVQRESLPLESKPLARYDVRSELSDKPSAKTTSSARAELPAPAKPAPVQKASLPEPATDSKVARSSTNSISESDLPIAKPSEAKVVAPVTQSSSECKEAMTERDRASEASDNSDKLFHLRRALRLCPQSAPLHYELGKVYSSMSRGSDAESEFKQALSIDPSFAAAKKAMSDMLKEEVQF